MKKFIKLFLILFVISISNSLTYSQIKIDSLGNVGINKSSPIYKLDINGHVRITPYYVQAPSWSILINNMGDNNGPAIYPTDSPGSLGITTHRWYKGYIVNLTQGSDDRFKTNIFDIDSALSRILKVKTVKYDYSPYFFTKCNWDPKMADLPESKQKNGFLAQQLLQYFPELVEYDTTNDMYGVNYIEMIPVIVSAMKEQQTQIETLQGIVTSQEQEIIKIKQSIGYAENNSKKSTFQETELDDPILYQNSPNPFYDQTDIKVFLPDQIAKAILYVHSLKGSEVMVKELNERGNLSVTIDGKTLKKGMYVYTLTVNGKLIDSKRMLLTD